MTSRFLLTTTVGLLVISQLIGDPAIAEDSTDATSIEGQYSEYVPSNGQSTETLTEPAAEPSTEPSTESPTDPSSADSSLEPSTGFSTESPTAPVSVPSTEPYIEQTEPPVESQQQKVEYLDLVEAREFALGLINADRLKEGLRPVKLDRIGNKAAQWHADEQAKDGYTNHWNLEGLKPPQRYSMCGGMDYVAENTLGTTPAGAMGWTGKLVENQSFTREEISDVHKSFMDSPEHRKNVMKPEHTHVGLGFRLVDLVHEDGGSHNRNVACAQEFINRYAVFRESSNVLVRNVPYKLIGIVQAPFKIYCATVKREELPKPITLQELHESKEYSWSYTLPDKSVASVFPAAHTHTPEARLQVDRQNFALTIVPKANWKPALYYISLWVSDPKGNQLVISTRVFELR